jgi:dimethylargininase
VVVSALRVGVRSSTAPLRDVLVKRPGPAFGRAFEDPAHGFLRPVDLAAAQREHDTLVETLEQLGVRVHVLDADGAIPLRPGKPNRMGEPAVLEAWLAERAVPIVGRIEAPGTVEAGDTVWLGDDIFVIGRSLRTNDAGARQLAGLMAGDALIVDVPYHKGPNELVHLMSVISPVADDLAVVLLPLLPAGLHERLVDLGVRLIEVPPEEEATLGCNVLAVRPGVVIVAEGNPVTRRALESAGVEVHAIPLGEVGVNGSGGVTCLTRPLRRES